MKVILSHPFSGAIYWWFANQISGGYDHASKRPGHPYYRTLYGNVDKHLDIALACAVVFDDIILPAADAVLRAGNLSPEDQTKFPELNMSTSEWALIRHAQEAVDPISDILFTDPVISSVLRRVPADMRSMALRYAAADILMMSEYSAPIICASGRRKIVRRLIELDVIDQHRSETPALDTGSILSSALENYTTVVGLTFGSDDAYRLASIKWNEKIRQYAQGFQSTLAKTSNEVGEGTLYELIADAWSRADLAQDISGTFSAASRTMSAVGLIPGLGSITGAVGLAADAASIASERRSEALRWYELGPEIARFRSLSSLESKLKQQKHL